MMYKVVYKISEKLYSYNTIGKYRLEYGNFWTFPQENTKIFVFKYLKDALKFTNGNYTNIYFCEVEGEPEKSNLMSMYCIESSIRRFWKKSVYTYESTTPHGTYFVEAVKLKGKVMQTNDIENIVKEFCQNNEKFSCFNVTEKLRKDNFWAPHDEVKAFVHDYMKTSTDYTSVNNGTYIEYQPLKNISKTTQIPKNTTLKVSSRNRVLIPAAIVKGLNLKFGDVIIFDGHKISTNLMSGQAYTVDKHNNIRVPVKKGGSVVVNIYNDHLEIV